jgi:ABC-type Zn2+ transport system substrate-binding protein/surface adhesin
MRKKTFEMFSNSKNSCGHGFQDLSILLERKVPLKLILLKELPFVFFADVYDYVELQFLDRNLQYFVMHLFGKF